MVETLTSELERESRRNILTPTIIETKQSQIDLVKQKLKDKVPFEELGTGTMAQIGEGLRKNILGKFQGSLVSFKQIPSFNMIAVPLFRDLVEEFADMREVDTMYYDKPMQTLQYPTVDERGVYRINKKDKDFFFTSTAWTRNLMGADRANQQGFSGQGMKTAVPDTGANRTNSAVRGNITVKSMMTDHGQYKDKNGHGMWCVSCIGGRSTTDPTMEVPTEGMAPRTDLLSLKVLGYVIGTGLTSDILQGMEYSWKQGADVVSMSLGGSAGQDPSEDPECQVIKRLTDEGMTFVIAAGNSGPDEKTIGTPGWCSKSLTVGAFDPMTGEIADFSSRGPTNDGRIKPDVVAPGVHIHSPIIGVLDGANDKRTQRFSPISGTSMATPHAAGIVTAMKQAKRSLVGEDLSTVEIKKMMSELGKGKDNKSGYGFLNWSKFEEWMSTEHNFDLTKGKPEAPPEEVPPEQGEESEQSS